MHQLAPQCTAALAESGIQLFEELTLQAEKQGLTEVDDNVRDALGAIGEIRWIHQAGAKLKGRSPG